MVLFIAFLPVSSFIFFLKNDAFNGYFPPKFFMSESIHAGYLPLWNPYINFGIPQYADMSGGYWNPITWLIASTVGYNAYTFTLEALFYILLAGTGMYRLSGLWITDKRVRIIAATAFMCCGYNVGHLQHFNWLSGAAFLPYCYWSYILLLKNFSARNILRASFLFYMLAAAAHPGITIGAFYFFTAVFFYHFFNNEKRQTIVERIKVVSKTHIILGLVLLLLSAGMITGYLDILPHFIRGEKISLADSLSNPTNIQSWISALLPFVTVKNDAFFNTDPSMRNSYFSISLLVFFLLAVCRKKNRLQFFLLLTGLFFALLAGGGIFKTIAYKVLPFIGYIRLNGEFRIFAILCFILVAAIELDKFILQKPGFNGRVKWIYYSIEIILFACIIIGIYKSFSSNESFIYAGKNIFSQGSYATKLKALIDAVSFYDTWWIQGIIQLFFLWGIKWCIRAGDWNLLKKITVINLVISCLLNIPYTGVGKASVADVQSILNRSAQGIPIPVLQPVYMNDTLTTAEKGLVGNWSLYNKQIGVKEEVAYPVILKNTREYFEKKDMIPSNNFQNQPFIFVVPKKENSRIVISQFSPNKINVSLNADTSARLVLQQNFYPHWFFYNGKEKTAVGHAGINFMSAPVSKGENSIIFSFEPVRVKWMMLLSACSLLVLIILLFALKTKPSSPS